MVRFPIKRILCLVLLAACLLSAAAADPLPTPSVVPSIDPNAGVRATPTPVPTPKPVRIPGWGELAFDTRAEQLYVDLFNPEENADLYYLTYTLYIVNTVVDEATGESTQTYDLVFSTGLIPPGLAVNYVTLEHSIEPGVYEACMVVQPYTMDSLSPCNTAQFELKLTVYDSNADS